jgi:predicted Zn-dependent protease
MNRLLRVIPVLALISLLLLALGSCSRDPNVRKQKYLDSGNKYLEAGKPREAVIEFQNAIKLDANFAPAYYGLAQAAAKSGDGVTAVRALNKSLELDPTNMKGQLEMGNMMMMIYASSHKPDWLDQAKQKAELVISKEPNNAQAYSLLSNVAANQKKPAEAMAQLQKAISLAPKNATFQLNLAILKAQQQDLPAAEAAAKLALQMEPKLAQGYQFLAEMYLAQKRWPHFEQDLKSGIDAVPNALPMRLQLAAYYLSPIQNKPELSQQVIADAKKAAGDNADARSEIANFEYTHGNVDQAFNDYAGILNDHPKDTGAKGRYAELLLQKGRDAEAVKQIDELLKMSPNDTRGRIIRGQILLKQNKPAEAIPILQAVVKDDPKEGIAHHFLGVAYATTGEGGQAEAEWREAIRLTPNSLQSYRLLAAVA